MLKRNKEYLSAPSSTKKEQPIVTIPIYLDLN